MTCNPIGRVFIMTELLAVPTEAPGGLDAEIAQHFGHCETFTLLRLDDGRLTATEVLPFGAHEHGNCLVPVGLLAQHGVTAMVARGMGARPLAGFLGAGIEPYFAGELTAVRELVNAYLAGELLAFSGDRTCAHHHDDETCDHGH